MRRSISVSFNESTVFLVDDDPAMLRSLAALVEIVFPRVVTFASAADFLAAFQPDHRPSCLVLDVAMPGMNGLELQQKLLDDKVDLPVVFITGHANVPMAVEAMQAGAVDFLEKPFHDQELWDSIHKALEIDTQNHRRKARRQELQDRLSQLNEGERAVLNLILDGKINKAIAEELGISTRTVEDRRSRIMKKMGAASVAELVQLTMTH
jgi:two-component system, LuxR family, response regulator FixJ